MDVISALISGFALGGLVVYHRKRIFVKVNEWVGLIKERFR